MRSCLKRLDRFRPPRREFDALAYHDDELDWFWSAYSGGRDITDDPFAAPLKAKSLTGLPPAFIVLGGCDFLRDEGGSTRLGCARTVSMPRTSATPAKSTGS